MVTNLQNLVLVQLRLGDRNLGELREVLDCSYPELTTIMEQLSKKDLVTHYFKIGGVVPVLTYCIKRSAPSLP